MSLLQVVVLAIVQGLTEFLPVSSSAHLIITSRIMGWPDQGLVLDVGVHLGTLLAVVFYFRVDLIRMLRAWLQPAQADPEMRRLGLYVALASLPVLIIGFLAYEFVSGWLRDLRVLACATLFFGVALWAADRFSAADRRLADLHLSGAMLIGLAQVLALIPGTSRSGVTLMAGRMLGLGRDAAARFSFLLAIPALAAAGGHGMLKILTGSTPVQWQEFAVGVLAAGLMGWICIAAFLALLQRVGLLPFIVYRLALGVFLLWMAF